MGEEAVEAILTVSHIEVNAGVVVSLNMKFTMLGTVLSTLTLAFTNCEVLISAESLDEFEFSFESLKLQKFLVVHLVELYIMMRALIWSLIIGAQVIDPKELNKSK